jgi:hypothetical protein
MNPKMVAVTIKVDAVSGSPPFIWDSFFVFVVEVLQCRRPNGASVEHEKNSRR